MNETLYDIWVVTETGWMQYTEAPFDSKMLAVRWANTYIPDAQYEVRSRALSPLSQREGRE